MKQTKTGGGGHDRTAGGSSCGGNGGHGLLLTEQLVAGFNVIVSMSICRVYLTSEFSLSLSTLRILPTNDHEIWI